MFTTNSEGLIQKNDKLENLAWVKSINDDKLGRVSCFNNACD